MTRLIAASMTVLALAFGASTASAATIETSVEDVPAAFTMSSTATNGVPGGCDLLPTGVEVSWEGTLHSVTLVKVEPNGALTIQNTSTASGKATDGVNEYAFSYSNHFKVTETAPESGLFSGKMTDHFSLAGNHVKLNNGFIATFTTNFEDAFELDPSREFGSPLDFETGAPLCDPL